MDPSVAEQVLDELLPSFEALETQSGAILQFLKDKRIATDEQLAPYLEQARNASTIRWHAVRLRMNRLLTPAFKTVEESAEKGPQQAAPRPAETGGESKETAPEKELKKDSGEHPEKGVAGKQKNGALTAEDDKKLTAEDDKKKAKLDEGTGERAA